MPSGKWWIPSAVRSSLGSWRPLHHFSSFLLIWVLSAHSWRMCCIPHSLWCAEAWMRPKKRYGVTVNQRSQDSWFFEISHKLERNYGLSNAHAAAAVACRTHDDSSRKRMSTVSSTGLHTADIFFAAKQRKTSIEDFEWGIVWEHRSPCIAKTKNLEFWGSRTDWCGRKSVCEISLDFWSGGWLRELHSSLLHQAIPVQKRTQFSAPERKKRDVHVN